MVQFPLIESLKVDGYGLYPGKPPGNPGLAINFLPGLTLVLGANGLGKTTLVTIIYRLLTGPYDVPALNSGAELGSGNITAKPMSSAGTKIFAARVSGGARGARASLSFSLGQHRVLVERNLQDLSLARLIVNDTPLGIREIEDFQSRVCALAGLGQFGDWILLLRHLVFYFEDRRALVWDPSAQRQLLRLLSLPPEAAAEWTTREREILQLDSKVRNLHAALGRVETDISAQEVRAGNGRDVAQELAALERLQVEDTDNLAALGSDRAELDSRRESARLRFLEAEQVREAAYRETERARLTAISARFPSKSDTARFILAQLMSDAECLVCGNSAPEAAEAFAARLRAGHCVVCGTGLQSAEAVVTSYELADKRAEDTAKRLARADEELSSARDNLRHAEDAYSVRLHELQRLSAAVADRSVKIEGLLRILSPIDASIYQQRSDLAALRARVTADRELLASKRLAFRAWVEEKSRTVTKMADAIQVSFSEYAAQFLYEKSTLVWAPRKSMVGQTGEQITFPAFELDLSGTDFLAPSRREGPDQVSESQREFIDLAFRMALMQVVGGNGGSLLIDAPEASLDAVFAPRAADVLARFAEPTRGNRLVIASNIVDGRLIPVLLEKASVHEDRDRRVVDLLEIATPTAAIRENREAYEAARDRILGLDGGDA
jgi:DNA repair exonuclease SbcCD ATPase subunit